MMCRKLERLQETSRNYPLLPSGFMYLRWSCREIAASRWWMAFKFRRFHQQKKNIAKGDSAGLIQIVFVGFLFRVQVPFRAYYCMKRDKSSFHQQSSYRLGTCPKLWCRRRWAGVQGLQSSRCSTPWAKQSKPPKGKKDKNRHCKPMADQNGLPATPCRVHPPTWRAPYHSQRPV